MSKWNVVLVHLIMDISILFQAQDGITMNSLGVTPFRVAIQHRYVAPHEVDPARVVYFSEQFLLANLTDTLVRIDDQGQIFSGIAKKWRLFENGSSVQFELNKFRASDGSEINAYDVQSSIKRLCLKKSNTHFPIHKYLRGGDSITTLSDPLPGVSVDSPYQITLHFTPAVPDVLVKLTHSEFGVIPTAAIDQRTLAIDWTITTGPFAVARWTEKEVALMANRYSPLFSSDMPDNVVVEFEASSSETLDDFLHGRVQLSWIKVPMNMEITPWLRNSPVHMYTRQFVYNNFLILNPEGGAWRDLKRRQILRDRIFSVDVPVDGTLFERAYGIFPKGLMGSHEKPHLNKVSSAEPVQLNVLVPEQYRPLKLQKINDLLREAGIEAIYEFAPIETVVERMKQRSFASAFMVCGVSARFADAFFNFFPKTGVPLDSDGEVSQLASAIRESSTDSQRNQRIHGAATHVLKEAVFIPLWYERNPIFLSDAYSIEGIAQFSEDIPLWKIRRINQSR